MLRPIAAVVILLSTASAGLGQTPLDSLGAAVKDGHLSVEADLQEGRALATPAYAVEVQGSPRIHVSAEALDGSVQKMHCDVDVENGRLIVRGKGLRPNVSIESLEFESPKGITDLRAKGIGIWRPIVAIFGGIARSVVVRNLELHTDIPSVLKGDILSVKTPAERAAAARRFLDLVTEVRMHDTTLTAFEGRALAFQPFLEFRTSLNPRGGKAMRLSIDKGVFRPGRDGAPAFLDLAGRLDGEFEDGTMEFGKDRSSVAHGQIQGGSFQVRSTEDGSFTTSFAASQLSLDLSSGHFEVPGGLRVELDDGSKFSGDDVSVTPQGLFSGVVDLDLAGRTGEFARQGAKITAHNVTLRSKGLRVENNRATGQVALSFDYGLTYLLVVHYPRKQIPEKRVPLEFHGPFRTTLELFDAATDGGEVRGDYVFRSPWPPIETAALEVLAAKWSEELAIGTVDFTLAPKLFRPCGPSCFELGFEFTAEKMKAKKSLFRQFCAPVGKAELFVDKEARACILRNVRVVPHCERIVGWVINLVAPLLAKTYSDTVLFSMPAGLPLTVESVQGEAEWIEIGGQIDWTGGATMSPETTSQ